MSSAAPRKQAATLSSCSGPAAASDHQQSEAVDVEHEPDETVVLSMRKVELGTFDCGACQVAFTDERIHFFPENNPNPHDIEEIVLEVPALTRMEVDKERSVLCVTGFFRCEITHPNGVFNSFCHHGALSSPSTAAMLPTA